MKVELDLLPLISLIALLGCSSQEIGSKGGELDLMIPIESAITEQSLSLRAFEAKDREGNRTLVQTSPALLSSPGNRMGRSLVGLMPGGGAGREWSLSEASEPEKKFSIDQSEEGLVTIREAGIIVLSYRFGLQDPPDVPADRHRSSYIHPILDTFGSPLTDDFPEDHLHHRGLSWMWPRITIRKQQKDLWHIRGVYQRFEKWLQKESGPVCAAVGIKNTWESDERTVVDEWVWVRVFAAGKRGRAIDLNLTWQAREEILIQGQEEKGYGGLCFRVAPRGHAVITTPSGRLLEDSDLQPFPWADYSGVFGRNQETSGVAIFQHSSNLDFPAGWCLRYYGFLGVSWPGIDPYVLEPGQPITMRFRIWIHDGDARNGAVEQAYAGFSSLPSVIFQKQTESSSW